MPKWSKSKKRIEEFMSEELKDKVKFYATVYRGTHDQLGKVWIELDKKIIFEANTLEWEIEYYTLSNEIRKINNCRNYEDVEQANGYYQAYDDAEKILSRKHKVNQFQFYKVMIRYLNTSFKDSLESEDQLTRIFCLLDRRLGKRRLKDITIRKEDSEGLKMLYKIRCQIAGINSKYEL